MLHKLEVSYKLQYGMNLMPLIYSTVALSAGSAASPLDPYNNSLVMPLAEFIEHPLAKELVHNGQSLQVFDTGIRMLLHPDLQASS